MTSQLPILYSFRRCPYVIRARLAIAYAGIAVEIREVQLKHKPVQMLAISPKGTVPVLQLQDGKPSDCVAAVTIGPRPGAWLRMVEDSC